MRALRLLVVVSLLAPDAWAVERGAAVPPVAPRGLTLPLDRAVAAPQTSESAAPVAALPDAQAAPRAAAEPAAAPEAAPAAEPAAASPESPRAIDQARGAAAETPAAQGRSFDGGGSGLSSDDGKKPFFVRHYGLLRPLRPVVKAWLRPKVYGAELVPKGALVVGSNHVAFGPDVLALSWALDRQLRYFFKRALHDAQPLKAKLRADDTARAAAKALRESGREKEAEELEHELLPVWTRAGLRAAAWAMPKLFGALGTIPVSSKDEPALVEASLETGRRTLRQGDAVAIFVDQELTRSGFIGGVRPGFARVANGVPGTPVTPVYLDGLWGHSMSRRRLPRRSYLRALLPRLRIFFGAPLRENTPLAMRLALEELSEKAMRARVAEERLPIAFEFLRRVRRRWRERAVSDASGRALTYGELALEVLEQGRSLDALLADKASEPSVAVMLPPSIEAAQANLALASIGRVVVNADYTAGRHELPAMLRKAGVRTILTTRGFARRQGLRPEPGVRLLFVEDLDRSIPPIGRFYARLLLRYLPERWAPALMPHASRDLEDEAAVVFTSGSDSPEKGVVLTHMNVLAGVEMAREVMPPTKRATVLAAMPFYSAFGVARGLWLPLLSGMHAAYHERFDDAAGIAALALSAEPTLLFATPAMLRQYSREIPKAAFASLKFVVSGAEKLHKAAALEFQRAFGVRPIEEYGSTETASLIALSVPEPALKTDPNPDPVYSETAGRNVPGTVLKVIDPDTGAVLPEGKTGLLVFKGANVMKRYLGDDELTAAKLRDGEYVTDDLGSIDREGRVSLAGPKARRSRIGADVISHAVVEEKLRAAAQDPAAEFAVTGVTGPDGSERLVALYAGWSGSAAELREKARALGLSDAWLPSPEDFHAIDAIPRLGNSKLDLMRVNELARGRTPSTDPAAR